MTTSAGRSQYLTFTLGNDAFALDILKVQEIKSWVTITPLPNTTPDVRGVINLRGAVVPVVDLRRRFNMPDVEPTKYSVIVVARVADKTVGLVVDAVSDVLDVGPEEISPPPRLESGMNGTDYLAGLVRTGERLLVLLDIERALGEAPSRAAA